VDLGLKNRAAIVAAASSGLGKEVALVLAEEGAKVALCSRRKEKIESAAEEIRAKTGSEVLAVMADVKVETDIAHLVSETHARFGRIDILVCNAGGPPAGFFLDFTADDWRKAVELNLISTVNLCRAVVPHMKERRWGRIINITSVAAKQPIDNLILSNAVRAGVLGFAKSLSNQVAADNITVNCVCPGYTLTQRLKDMAETIAKNEGIGIEEVHQRWQAGIPMRRLSQPREFADVVAFLASERASYLTGAVIQVDGGVVKGLF
jgi:3-oxoacyl-[acyl-carrier protein] reductase